MDNPGGQVTYPVFTGRPGYLPALAHLVMRVAFLSLSFILSLPAQNRWKYLVSTVLSLSEKDLIFSSSTIILPQHGNMG